MTPAALILSLLGVWEMRTFHSSSGPFTLERLNMSQVSPTLLQGVTHVPEGRTWGASPLRELRVEFLDPSSPSGRLSQRTLPLPVGQEEEEGEAAWALLCDFALRPASEGLLLSASPACTWSLSLGENASSPKEWTLSVASPYLLQHGVRRPAAAAPLSSFQRYLQYGLLATLFIGVQAGMKVYKQYMLKGLGKAAPGAKGSSRSIVDAQAERERAAKRAAAAGADTAGSASAKKEAGKDE